MKQTNPHYPAFTFDDIFDGLDIGLAIVNQANQIIKVNPYLLNIFNYKQEDLLFRPIELLFPKICHASNHKPILGIKKNNDTFPIEVSESVFVSQNEKFKVVIITNITPQQKKINDLLEDAKLLSLTNNQHNQQIADYYTKLTSSNQRLEELLTLQESVLNNMSVMTFLLNRDGVFQFINHATSFYSGFTKEELLLKENVTLFFDKTEIEQCRQSMYDEYGVQIDQDVDVIRLMAEKNKVKDKECYLKNKNKTQTPIQLSVTALKDKQNNTIGYLGIGIDISIIKEAEKKLALALKAEKETSELKSRFVSIASHEFRTPLSTILSSAYLANNYTTTEEQPKRDKHLHRIVSSVNLMSDILNDFLSAGKIDSGKISVKIEQFDFQKVANTIISYLHANFKRGQNIVYKFDGHSIVYSDPLLIRNILVNLLSNAIKYSPENTSIHLDVSTSNNCIAMTIKDYGIGIPIEDQKHLMERFFRGSNVLNEQGSGLGLHIVSKYIEELKGDIRFQSDINEGTTFFINIPNLYPVSL